MKKYLLILVVFLLFADCISNAQNCSQKAESIKARGFYIGMSDAEALRLYPKLDMRKFDEEVTGQSLSSFDPWVYPEMLGESNIDIQGFAAIFLDHRLASLEITYRRNWNTTAEFVDALAPLLKLPSVAQWSNDGNDRLRLTCSDVVIQVRTSPPGATLTMSRSDFDAEIAKRTNEAISEHKSQFRPNDIALPHAIVQGKCIAKSFNFPLWKLRLGMSPSNVKKLYKQFQVSDDPNVFHFNNSVSPEDERGDSKDMPNLTLDFLDNKLIRIAMGFRDKGWASLDEFAAGLVGQLGIDDPNAWARSKQGLHWQTLTADCSDFVASIGFYPRESKWESQGTNFRVSIKDYDGEIQRSVQRHKDNWKP